MFYPLYDSNPVRHVTRPFVNYGLIALNVAIFAVQSLLGSFGTQELVVMLGMTPAIIQDIAIAPVPVVPDEATFITYAFLHADIWHLGSNMLFLWVFGDNVEDALGHVKYLIFYLASAVFAGLAHLATNEGSFGPLIGASGAVAGVIGAYLLLYPRVRVYALVKIVVPLPIPVPAAWMLGAWIVSQLIYAFVAADEPVAWWAHVGGFVAGIVMVPLLKRRGVPIWG